MTNHLLLITNPPHPKIDAHAAAEVLGIPAAEANLKARYGIPEIWAASTDRSLIEADAATLREANMRCVVITGEQLARVPSQQLVRGVELTEQGIRLRAEDGTRDVAQGKAMIVLPVSPRPAEGAPPGTRVTVAPAVLVSDVCPYLDVFMPDGNRYGIYEELVDFGEAGGVTKLADIIRERLPRARFDERLNNMQLRRPRQMLPAQMRDARRGYSFASPGLDALLNTIAPELQNVSQAEWSARLAFLTTLSSLATQA